MGYRAGRRSAKLGAVKSGSKSTGNAPRAKETPALAPPGIAIPYPPGLYSVAEEAARPIPHFSPREQHVGAWMAEGKTDAEIAHILGIGRETVKTHVKGLFEKLDLENRKAVVAWIWRNRLAAELSRARPRQPVKYT